MNWLGKKRSTKDYKKVYEAAGYFTEDMRELLAKFMSQSNISGLGVLFLYFVFFPLGIYLTYRATLDAPGSAGEFIIMGCFLTGGAMILIMKIFLSPISKKATKAFSDANNIFFNNFLAKKLVIAYSTSDLDRYSYDKGEIINVEIKNPYSPNQYIHDFAIEAFMKDADGFVLLEKQESMTKLDAHNKKTDLVPFIKAQAMLINNVRKNANSSNSSDKTDIGYWHELLQKGAITEEEYNKKKEELL